MRMPGERARERGDMLRGERVPAGVKLRGGAGAMFTPLGDLPRTGAGELERLAACSSARQIRGLLGSPRVDIPRSSEVSRRPSRSRCWLHCFNVFSDLDLRRLPIARDGGGRSRSRG